MMILIYLIAITILLFLLIGTILIALNYFGLFDNIQVSTGKSPFQFENKKIIFRLSKGQYYDSSPIFTEICSIIPNIKTTFGIFLHHAYWNDFLKKQVQENIIKTEPSINLTSNNNNNKQDNFIFMIGAIIPDELDQQPETPLRLLEEKGYQFGRLPNEIENENVVYCRFPYRGILSVVVASKRVYAAIKKYLQENRLIAYPNIEIYHQDDIYFIVPLTKHENYIQLFVNNVKNDEKQQEKKPQNEIKSDSGDAVHSGNEVDISSHNDSDSSYEIVDNES